MADTSERSPVETVSTLMEAIRNGDLDQLDDVVAVDYIQHNPHVGNGLVAFRHFVQSIGRQVIDVHRIIAERDLVVVHSHYRTSQVAVVDIFRIDSNGKVAEHWDVIQPVTEPSVSGNDMFTQLADSAGVRSAGGSELHRLREQVSHLSAEVIEFKRTQQKLQDLLDAFDRMDFEGYSMHDWNLFREMHSADAKVTMPDGSIVSGIDPHVMDMERLVAFMPDARVESHPIRIAMGDWTAVTGVTTGTFTSPMRLPDGTEIAPTGSTLRLGMATFARWKDGKIVEELLFWDSAEFARQLGLK